MDLTDFIYDFNLSTTGTVKDIYEWCQIVNSGRKGEIDYKNSVSLYDIVDYFNTAYLAYRLEKDELKKVLSSLGEKIKYGYHSVSEDFSVLVLDVVHPYVRVLDAKRAIISFVSKDDELYVRADNGRNWYDKKYKSKHVDIDQSSVRNCLNIVSRHDLFLESYAELKDKFVFGNGTTVMFSKIDGDIIDELSTFTISFGNSYMNTHDFIEIKIKLGDEVVILYDESKVEISSKEIKEDDEKKRIIDELLRSIYINSDNLSNLYRLRKSEKVLEKRNYEWKRR